MLLLIRAPLAVQNEPLQAGRRINAVGVLIDQCNSNERNLGKQNILKGTLKKMSLHHFQRCKRCAGLQRESVCIGPVSFRIKTGTC